MIKINSSNNGLVSVTSKGTIMQSLEHGSVKHVFQCKAGLCGACKCKLKSGSVRYTTEPIGFIASGEILPCVSIADGDIEIEF
ncbi:class I ribonucleotide reductase maintenance protein YfaE [Pseudoalteromonas sp. SK20]|uniref:class I ribonucleotide reductase maintenance protein YfaE n=1 Tax=Pseudoalteromonas sp. SK20 TaxID=1938367 RepID=UPI000975AC50|nr:class I ribonucleotide reductase maintenance protein YfaE [Pseudoalteromonas sp. SK20]